MAPCGRKRAEKFGKARKKRIELKAHVSVFAQSVQSFQIRRRN
jgi:hypothetical protein